MVTKDDREESTRIHSQSELDEMVRKSRTPSVPDADDFDAHTQVGKLDELVARTRTNDEPASQTSAHVVRRASSPVIVPPRAAGSQADVYGHKRDDDVAFEEYEEVEQPTFGAASLPLPLPAPPVSMPLPVVAKLPAMPEKRAAVRWGLIAWLALLAAMIGVGTVGYVRIRQLETELAAAKSQLK